MVEFNNILLILLIFIIIITLFINNREQFHDVDNTIKYDYTAYNDIVNKKYNNIKCPNPNPIKENDAKSEYYINKFLMGNGNDQCYKPTQSIKDFNNNFFSFRDYTQNNSSMMVDSVDKITNLYLDGHLGEARRYPGAKIKDIFDNAVCGPNLYERGCVRAPNFNINKISSTPYNTKANNAIHDGYDSKFLKGLF